MDLKKYKKLYKKLSKILGEIDPCYYNGPLDEYDFQVNKIIRLIETEEVNSSQLIELFFGERKNISPEEQEKIEELIKKILQLNEEII